MYYRDFLLQFLNPDDRVLIRVGHCSQWHRMLEHHGLLPTGTLVKVDSPHGIGWTEYQEEKVLRARARATGAKFPSDNFSLVGGGGINWDTLQTGDRIDWWKSDIVIKNGDRLMLLGHVVFPWYAMKSGGGGALEKKPLTLCTQVWQRLDSVTGGGKPFATCLRKCEYEIELMGTCSLQTTDDFFAKEDGVMSGLSFEVVDQTFLRYQPEWVKKAVDDLLYWNDVKKND